MFTMQQGHQTHRGQSIDQSMNCFVTDKTSVVGMPYYCSLLL